MPEELTPVIREEEYLAAIACQDVTPPDPATRKEEWLDLIADNVAGLAGDLSTAEGEIDDLQDLVPTPEAADSGKVLTAGADGTASWQTAGGGGGGNPVVYVTEDTYTLPDGVSSIADLVGKPVDIYYQGTYSTEFVATRPVIEGVIYGANNYYVTDSRDDIVVNSTTSASIGKALMVYVFKTAGVLQSYWYGQDASGYISLSDNPS